MIREIFSLKEIQTAVNEVKESALASATSEEEKMHIIQMAGNIIRNLMATFSHKEMNKMEDIVYFSEEMIHSIEARDAGQGPCLPGVKNIDALAEAFEKFDPGAVRAHEISNGIRRK